MKKATLDDLIGLLKNSPEKTITAHKLAKMLDKTESYVRKKSTKQEPWGIPSVQPKEVIFLSYEHGDIAKTIQSLTNRINTQIKAINGLTNRIAQRRKE